MLKAVIREDMGFGDRAGEKKFKLAQDTMMFSDVAYYKLGGHSEIRIIRVLTDKLFGKSVTSQDLKGLKVLDDAIRVGG